MKLRLAIGVLFVHLGSCSFGQNAWNISSLPDMPEPVSNNAVTAAYCGDSLCLFSFCGIDSTKAPSGIHLKSWRFNTVSQVWTNLPDVPDVQGKIAASASTINNLIYVVGGYYVNEDFSELSSDDIHVFDPETNTWLDDGANIPVAIDDHVYDVWNDSLIFIVTGWSDSQNVRDVQIYNPTLDEWQAGTDLPITNLFPVFGGSGSIAGDSLYYLGGVNNSFSTMSRLRKGNINPEDPTDIEWTVVGESPFGDFYRCASANYQDRFFFIGGSSDGYNFDGISYANNQGVDVEYRIVTYYSNWDYWDEEIIDPINMDLRGLAQLTETSWVICGGMSDNQIVTNEVLMLEYQPASFLIESNDDEIQHVFDLETKVLTINSSNRISTVHILNTNGQLIQPDLTLEHTSCSINFSALSKGMYVISVHNESGEKHFPFVNR